MLFVLSADFHALVRKIRCFDSYYFRNLKVVMIVHLASDLFCDHH